MSISHPTSLDTLPLVGPAPSFAVHAFGLTNTGRVRSSNEDQFLIAELSRRLRIQQTSLAHSDSHQSRSRAYVLLVADGMGGHAAGEVASALSVEVVETFIVDLLRRFSNLRAEDERGVIQDLREAVQQADMRILVETVAHPELAGMGTTLTMAFISGKRLFVIHAGDSRCYLWRGGHLEQLTHDHTWAAELARRGAITADQVRHHPRRHIVTNVLGGGTSGVHVEVQQIMLEPADVVLLCSDGLTDMVADQQLAKILMAELSPEQACSRLIAEANNAGGKDNITAVVARFDLE